MARRCTAALLLLLAFQAACSRSSGSAGDPDIADPDAIDDVEDTTDPDTVEPDADTAEIDEPLTARCAADPDCGPGRYCGALQQCRQDCNLDAQCGDGNRCAGNGKCAPKVTGPRGRPCAADNQCNWDEICDLAGGGRCKDGCRTAFGCAFGRDCVNGTCAAVAEGDRDRPEGTCDTSLDCAPGETCNNGLCGPAPDLDEPDLDDEPAPDLEPDNEGPDLPESCEADDACPAGYFCGSGTCTKQCDAQTRCPAGFTCNDRGRCTGGGDPDDGPQGQTCTADAQCTVPGTHCRGGICDSECRQSDDCAEGRVCRLTDGRCVNPEQAEPEPDPIEPFDATPCTTDAGCAEGNFCAPQGFCTFECRTAINCGAGFTCDTRGRCRLIGADPDDEQPCTPTSCTGGTYCDLPTGKCKSDCTTDAQCGECGRCDTNSGRCVTIDFDCVEAIDNPEADDAPTSCTGDAGCPAGWYCGLSGTCTQDCVDVTRCGSPLLYVCTDRGRCQFIGGDMDIDLYDQDEAESNEPEPLPEFDDVPPPGYCGPLPMLPDTCWSVQDCRQIIASNGCECRVVNRDDNRTGYDARTLTGGVCGPDTRVCDPLATTPCAFFFDCVDNRCTIMTQQGGTCRSDTDCRLQNLTRHYCDTAASRCRQDCTTNFQCRAAGTGTTCDSNGRCVGSLNDADVETESACLCDLGQYCDAGGRCVSDCSNNDTCRITTPDRPCCTTDGRCVAESSPGVCPPRTPRGPWVPLTPGGTPTRLKGLPYRPVK